MKPVSLTSKRPIHKTLARLPKTVSEEVWEPKDKKGHAKALKKRNRIMDEIRFQSRKRNRKG